MQQEVKKPAKVYFENLNAIRFIATFLVIIHHTEQFKSILKLPNAWGNETVRIIGELGVILFFVLSGFLITYLLFKEEEVTGTIAIKDFYMRRILRIWPLYYLIVLLAFFVLPYIDIFTLDGMSKDVVWGNLFKKMALFVFFMPNVELALFGVIPHASQTWSIGAEEQFYLIWPILNKFIRNKLALMLGVISAYLLIKFGLPFVIHGPKLSTANAIILSTPIDCMAIGGLFALIVYKRGEINPDHLLIKTLYSKWTQWIVLAGTITLIITARSFGKLTPEGYAVLFGILICNFAANAKRIFSMEYNWTNYLGKISFGLYIYHPIAIVFWIRMLQNANLLNDYLLFPCVIITVIIMSALSYELFEKQFIKRKMRFTKFVSGENAK